MSRKLLLVAASLLFPVAAANAEHITVVVTPSYHDHVHYVAPAPVCVTPARVCVTPVIVHPAPVVTRTVTTTVTTTQSVHYVR